MHVTSTAARIALIAAIGLAAGPLAGIVRAAPPPSAVDDAWTTDEDLPTVVDAPGVLDNDGTPGEGNAFCVASVDTGNLHGTLDWNADGSFTYTPSANYHGSGSANSFTYTMYEVTQGDPCAANNGSTATVEITVSAVNDAPTASADSFQALKNTTLNIGAPGVLSNDSDIDGDSLTAIKVNNPTHGVVVLAADGSFSYTPATGYTGVDTFSYKASDGNSPNPTSATRVVTITVSSVPAINTPTPPPPPTPVPTVPTPGETLTPLVTPPVDATFDPGASPTAFVPPTAQVSGQPTAGASIATLAPGQTPVPGGAAGDGSGSPLTILLGVVLLALIFGVAAAMYGPRWLEARRNHER